MMNEARETPEEKFVDSRLISGKQITQMNWMGRNWKKINCEDATGKSPQHRLRLYNEATCQENQTIKK